MTASSLSAGTTRERPILFSGPMVRAILDGSKTQTRRVVTFPRAIREVEGGALLTALDRMQDGYADGSTRAVFDFDGEPNSFAVRCPYGQPGDRLWVREGIRRFDWIDGGETSVEYTADCAMHPDAEWVWKRNSLPSMLMPRGLSRLTLEITGVRVERVASISRDDALAEGVERVQAPVHGAVWRDYSSPVASSWTADPRRSFSSLWDSLNAARGYGWDANPWCWVIEFRALSALTPSQETKP